MLGLATSNRSFAASEAVYANVAADEQNANNDGSSMDRENNTIPVGNKRDLFSVLSRVILITPCRNIGDTNSPETTLKSRHAEIPKDFKKAGQAWANVTFSVRFVCGHNLFSHHVLRAIQ